MTADRLSSHSSGDLASEKTMSLRTIDFVTHSAADGISFMFTSDSLLPKSPRGDAEVGTGENRAQRGCVTTAALSLLILCSEKDIAFITLQCKHSTLRREGDLYL